jgi:hypothetical protein
VLRSTVLNPCWKPPQSIMTLTGAGGPSRQFSGMGLALSWHLLMNLDPPSPSRPLTTYSLRLLPCLPPSSPVDTCIPLTDPLACSLSIVMSSPLVPLYLASTHPYFHLSHIYFSYDLLSSPTMCPLLVLPVIST